MRASIRLSLIVLSALIYSCQVDGQGIDFANCGHPAVQSNLVLNNPDLQILKGQDAKPHSYPWLVSLRVMLEHKRPIFPIFPLFKPPIPPSLTHICGGSLIGTQYVLTAAHCVAENTAAEMKVVVGLQNVADALTPNNTFQVINIVIHEGYNAPEFLNDVAILKLDRPVTISPDVSTICLPPTPDYRNDIYLKTAISAGWGAIKGKFSPNNLDLQEMKTSVIEDNICLSLYTSTTYIPGQQFCTLDKSKRRFQRSMTCFGDSGGPLMYPKDGKWFIYGVVSFASNTVFDTCNPKKPEVFTSIPFQTVWVQDNVYKLQKL